MSSEDSSSTKTINAKAKKGITLLLGRQAFLQILTFGGGVIVARILTPTQFGLFGIASFFVGIIALFGDFGLSSFLIQRKKDITEKELQIGFSVQQLLTLLVVFVLFLIAPLFSHLYRNVPAETLLWLIRALALSLILASWRSISALQMERNLRYQTLAWIEVVEAVSYQVILVLLVVTKHGIWSLAIATIVRGLTGSILMYVNAPWPIRVRFDKSEGLAMIKFGIPFQLQLIANQLDAWITPVLTASIIGPQAVGFIAFASTNGQKPIVLVGIVTRVAFPHLARLQDNRAEVERVIARYLAYLLTATMLWFAVLVTVGPGLVAWIFTNRWQPAIFALIVYACALNIDVLSIVLSVTLSSVGAVNKSTQAEVVRTVYNILISVPLVLLIGFNGVVIGYIVSVALAVVLKFRSFGQHSMRRLLDPIAKIVLIPFLASVSIGAIVVSPSFHGMIAPLPGAFTVALVYVVVLIVVGPAWLFEPALSMTKWSRQRLKS